MNILAIILAFFFGVLTVLGILLIKREYDRRIHNLSAQISELIEQVKSLQQAGPKRLPYRSADEIENATAAVLTLLHEERLKMERIENALAHLQKARNPDRE